MSGGAAEMPFLDHLRELRKRLIIACCAIGVGAILCFTWSEALFSILTSPLRNSFSNLTLIGTGPADAFVIKLKLSIIAGLVLTSPISFYQLWLFVVPGMHENERKFAIPFVWASTAFFLVGILFCFNVVLPTAFHYFSDEFGSISVTPNIRVGEYLGFATTFLLIFGVVFEMPVLCYFLARMGLVTHKLLIEKGRMAIVIIFIAAGVLTPTPDVLSQMLLAGPLLVLYALCIGVAYWVEKKKAAVNA